MPNYSPTEETSLMALLAALRGGMEPTTGYQMFSDVLDQQAARVDERQARLTSLQDLIASQAQSGQSLAGVNALANAYTPGGGGIPPMIQDTIGALYPDRARYEGQPSPAQQAYTTGITPSELGGGFGPEGQGQALPPGAYAPTPPTPPGQQFSPATPPLNPVDVLTQQASAVQAQQTIDEANNPAGTLGDVVTGIYEAKAKNKSNADILAAIRADPEAMEIVTKNYSALGKMFPDMFPDRSQPQQLGR